MKQVLMEALIYSDENMDRNLDNEGKFHLHTQTKKA